MRSKRSRRDARIAAEEQGHSKNPFCDEGDGFGAVFAEVFAGLAHGEATGSDEVEDEIAQGGERAGAGAATTAIFVHGHVADIVQLIFNAPVGACDLKEPIRAGLGLGQAGDKVGNLDADLVADAALPLDAHDLGGARPFEVRDDLGADRDPARLDAAVTLLDGLRDGAIRRRSGGDGAT